MVAASGKSPKTENGGISSKVGFQGLMKKGFIIIIVLAATFLDRALGTDKMIFQLAAAGYYIANEGHQHPRERVAAGSAISQEDQGRL